MVASGKTLGLPYAKSKVPTFEPKVPSCPGFASGVATPASIVDALKVGSRSAAEDSRELRLGPMRSGYLCPL